MSRTNASTEVLALRPAGALFLLGEAGSYLLPLVLGPLSKTYSVSESAAGYVIALQLGAFSFAAIFLAARLRALDIRRTAIIASLAIAAGNLLSVAQVSLAALLAGRVMAGLGEGVAEAVAAAVIARAADPDRAFAQVFAAVVAMAILIYLGLPELIQGLNARQLFFGMACVPLLALPWVLRLPEQKAIFTLAPAASAPFSPSALAVCIALALYSMSANAAWFYLERIASSVGMNALTYGRLIAAAAVIALLGPWFAHWLGARIGRLIPLTVACCIVAAGGWLATNSAAPVLFTIGVASSSAALLFGSPYFMGLAAELDPLGGAAAAARGFNGLGATLAPAMAGITLAVSHGYPGIGWASVVTAMLSFSLVMSVIMYRRQQATSVAGSGRRFF